MVAAIENCVAEPSSLGLGRLGVTEYWAIPPVPPALPQAPQVSQCVESSMLSITVGPPGLGVGVGTGVGVGVGTGVPGPEDGGLPCALMVAGVALPPPQAVSVKVISSKAV